MNISHRIVIIGGGNAGISVAARLRKAGEHDVALIEPSSTHYYQPLWTLVGGGQARVEETAKPEADVIPQGVAWIKATATSVDTEHNLVQLDNGSSIHYEYLVVAAGIQLDWNGIPGLEEALKTPQVSSNYSYALAPQTWEGIKNLTSGTAVFTMPTNPIKCGGAPQKIAYLAADYWREQGVLNDMRVVLVLPSDAMFGVEEFSRELEKVVERYGIDVRLSSEATAINSADQTVRISSLKTDESEDIHYDFLHVVPPQSAPDWIKKSPLADPENPLGYVAVDPATLQHREFENVFSLGDVCSAPNSKTGAAIRKQAPVLVANLLSVIRGEHPTARYNGYASCPLVTSRSTMLLAEFDYDMRPAPSIPFINTMKERKDMWYLKRYGLPQLYWKAILKGLA
ncbi:FAD/NAD(P)-binding oxidoreductase [Rothia sp. LK2588]|uniref:NAD(P)/FAD-dependent oxidoreductase n=1 Tax=Rothia sp. LK2588 TaxID=3114369 RepID=UPI0034CF97A5